MPRARRPLPVALALAAGLVAAPVALPTFGPAPAPLPALFAPAPLLAQSIVRGELEGVVRGSAGRFLAEAYVTATEVRTGTEVGAETARDGTFRISLLRSGEFEIRIEALGYMPQLLRGVRVPPGQTVRLSVELVSVPPPVETVDTVFVGGGGHPRYGGETGRRITRGEVGGFPERRIGFGTLAALNPVLDESLGSEGLPGVMTQVVLDGIPFTPAAHPLQRGGAGDLPFLPRIALDQLEVHRGTDVEWHSATGSYVSAMSRPAFRDDAVEVFASGTRNPLWRSSPVARMDEPDMHAGWGGASLHLALGDGGSHLFVGLEGVQALTPQLPLFSEEAAERLAESWPGGEGPSATELSSPWLARLKSFSGLSRLDWQVAENADVMARVGFASLRDGGTSLFARPLEYGVTAPMEGQDVTAGASVVIDVHPSVDLELRTGFERSVRDWGSTDGGSDPAPIPPTRFQESGGLLTDPDPGLGALLGPDPGLAGRVTRRAFQGGGTVHLRLAEHRIKAGVAFSFPSYEYRYVYRSAGEFFFSDPEAMAMGEGVFFRATGGGQSRSFSVPEVGLFAQHKWDPLPGIRLTSGLRFDRETLPDGDVPLNRRWHDLTGIRSNEFRSALNKVSTRLGLSWDLSGDGRTMMEGGVAAHHGRFDPAAMNEVIALSGSVRNHRQVGDLGAWPDLPPSGDGEEFPTLAMFGPRLDAPRTARAALGLSQQIGNGTVLHLSGTLRQTRNILRRSDLNLTPGSVEELEDGRPVYGELVQVGSLIVADPGTNRRFAEFDQVWALNADGWSDYRGITVALEHEAGPALDFFASYTFSETEDNLVGARSAVPEAGAGPELGEDGTDWSEGVSDFDAPHRATLGVRARFPVLRGFEVTGRYRYRSGVPFTPGYRPGVDVNGDGSGFNDPAFIAEGGTGLPSCLNAAVGEIAPRNLCRGNGVSFLDLHLALGVARVGPVPASLTVDVFNLLDTRFGVPDTALWLVDPDGSVGEDPETGAIRLPLVQNPSFGLATNMVRPGMLIRIGFKVMLP